MGRFISHSTNAGDSRGRESGGDAQDFGPAAEIAWPRGEESQYSACVNRSEHPPPDSLRRLSFLLASSVPRRAVFGVAHCSTAFANSPSAPTLPVASVPDRTCGVGHCSAS